MNPKAVVLLSGGLDCSTAAAQAIEDGYKVIALSFRYGQGKTPLFVAPLVMDSKVDIVRRSLQLGVPIESSLATKEAKNHRPSPRDLREERGGQRPCGLCDSCRIRNRALIEAGHPELTTIVGRSL